MGHLETSRYKNMVMNYEVMIRMGKNWILLQQRRVGQNGALGNIKLQKTW